MKKLLSIILIGLFIPINIYSQSFCETSAESEYNEIILNSSYRNSDLLRYKFCVNIYIHVVRKSDGTGGQTPAFVNLAISHLNSAYNPHDIYFKRIGGINYIDNTTIYN